MTSANSDFTHGDGCGRLGAGDPELIDKPLGALNDISEQVKPQGQRTRDVFHSPPRKISTSCDEQPLLRNLEAPNWTHVETFLHERPTQPKVLHPCSRDRNKLQPGHPS